MPARLRGLLALTLSSIFLVSLVAVAPALAAPTWLEPKNLSEPQFAGFGPDVAIDGNGDTVATWFGSQPGDGELVQTSERPHGGAWGPAVTRNPEDGAGAGGPDIGISSAGTAVIVWEFDSEEDDPLNRGSFIEAGIRTSGAWTPKPLPKDSLDDPLQFSYFPRVAVNARGDALAVWQECYSADKKQCFHGEGEYEARAAFRPAGQDWRYEPSMKVSDGQNEDAEKLFPAISESGDFALVWEDMKDKVARVSLLRAGASDWSPPQTLAPTPSGSPQIAFTADGTATAVWDEKDEPGDKRFHVKAATAPPGSTAWTPALPISGAGFDAFQPHIAVTPGGDAIAVWETLEGGHPIQAAIRSGGIWQPAQNLSAEGIEAQQPRLAMNAAGAAIVAWKATGSSGPIVQGVARPAGGGWTGPQTLSGGTVGAVEPEVAIDSEGSGVAVWRAATGGELIQAAGLDASGPRLGGLSIPATAAPGQALPFAVAPVDAWSALADTSWSFGDGGSASGSNVSHAFDQPGTYQVTVTSSDVLGNVSTATGRVTVTSVENKPGQVGGGDSSPGAVAQPGAVQQPPRAQKPKPHGPAANGIARLVGAAAVRGGKAILTLQCGRAARCSGLAKLVFERTYVIGKSRFKISAGSSRTLRIPLGPAAVRLLEGSRGQQLEVRLEGRGVKAQKVVLGL